MTGQRSAERPPVPAQIAEELARSLASYVDDHQEGGGPCPCHACMRLRAYRAIVPRW